jgi:transposase
MRWIGLDCHLEFIEVAILDAAGALVSTGRIESSEEAIRLFAESLADDDRVVLESSANAAAIAALIRPHAAEVVIANSRRLAQISQARAKTDRLDARTLAKLLRAGALEEVWMPDERTRARRRLCSRRAALVRAAPGQRTRPTPCWRETSRDAHRRAISSATPAGAGWPPWSCPPTSG